MRHADEVEKALAGEAEGLKRRQLAFWRRRKRRLRTPARRGGPRRSYRARSHGRVALPRIRFTSFTNMFSAAVSDVTMRPNPTMHLEISAPFSESLNGKRKYFPGEQPQKTPNAS